MPLFTAKKRCFYGGEIYEKGAVEKFSESVSAASWEAMDEEGKELLVHPKQPEVKEDNQLVSGEELAELQGVHEVLLTDFTEQGKRLKAVELERDTALESAVSLKQENEALAKSAEVATALQAQVANLKKLVADNENKSVLEEAIQNL
ncbi:hypothetical protein [Halodesulfovibrio spirochaetisodalis]|uniref:Uncharacterized protein n=1 Tax=Halodesulfovibrio spirochaetisodalis TaxID=1560234 RepID=A0A1B7XA49_9BACT|nr:hypothetical protein [Halodesulfovibrio spirochaetisodalis]OBQ46212.1 hypothetical protein SP90_13505 [Halodesulfovibrio spirochaetisodalis]